MPKLVRYAVALVFCFVILIAAVYAGARGSSASLRWNADMYISQALNDRQQGLDIRGDIPVVLDTFGPAYEEINAAVDSAVDALIDSARRVRARSIYFEYEIFDTDTVVSIVISATTRAVTDRTVVRSVNFDPRTGAFITLAQAMGRDITPIVEGKISEMIRQSPTVFYAAFTAPPTGQAFYLTETTVVLLFDEFQLSSMPGGLNQIELVRDNIMVYTIPRESYFECRDRYILKMMPLRRILEGMGYGARWCTERRVAEILMGDNVIMTLTPGENNYQLDGVLQRSLEAPPTQKNGGSVYVPISFFDQVLGIIIYDIDAQGNITFMNYVVQ